MILTHEYEAFKRRVTRVNGAVTYSIDFCNIVAPELTIPDGFTLSTCQPMGGHKVITILHSYTKNTIEFVRRNPNTCFITHYRPMALRFGANYIPMSIDISALPEANPNKNGKWIYFGNLMNGKHTIYNQIRKLTNCDLISMGRFNDKPIRQAEAHEIINEYSYGIGVGRCALEMYAMGLKVLVAGERFGGVALTLADYLAHQSVNFNGRVRTGDAEICDCIKLIDHAYTPYRSMLNMGFYAPEYQKVINAYAEKYD